MTGTKNRFQTLERLKGKPLMLKDKFKMYTQSGPEEEEELEIPIPLTEVQKVVKTLVGLSEKYTVILNSTVLLDQLDNTIEFRLKLGR